MDDIHLAVFVVLMSWIAGASNMSLHRAQEDAMQPGRVIYVYDSLAKELPDSSYVELGSVEGGSWGVVGDETLLSLLEPPPAPPLLFFSRAAYDRAVKGLASHEVQEVVVHRLEQWAPRALDEALDWLYRRGRHVLLLTAQARATDTDAAAALREYSEQILHRLAKLVGQGRYDDVSLVDMLIYTLEGEAELIAEYEHARSQEEKAWPQLDRWIELRRNFASTLGQALARRGRSEYGDALPYLDLERVFWVRPRDEELMELLTLQRVPFAEWENGVIVSYPIRKRDVLEEGGRSTTMLYFSTGLFLEQLQELTPAQQNREYTTRLEEGMGQAERTEYLATLTLEQVLLRINLQKKARSEDASLTRQIGAQHQEEREVLQHMLAPAAIWWAEQTSTSAEEAINRVRRKTETLVHDAELLTALVRVADRPELQERLEAVTEALEEDRAHLLAAIDANSH